MAATTGFKQQCPGCEGLVLIKSKDLVGKRVECPKCKERFVVEDPVARDKKAVVVGGKGNGAVGDETLRKSVTVGKPKTKAKPAMSDDEDEGPPSKANGKTGIKANGKTAVKPRRDEDDEDEDEDRPK